MFAVPLFTAHCRRALSIIALCAAPLLASAADDGDFLAAKAAYDRGDRARLDQLASALTGHPLEVYVDYWRLRLAIDTAPDEDVRRFLQRNAGGVLADRLRIEWAKALARRGAWTTFAAELPATSTDDVELACFTAQYRWQSAGDAALAAVKPLWFSGANTPDACQPLFDALIARGDLTTTDRRARFRLAAQSGNLRLAQSIAAELPPPERITQAELLQVDRDPLRALSKTAFKVRERSGQELLLYALERASRTDAPAARAAWERQRVHLPVAERRYGNVRIAYHAARQLAPQANEWFREVEGATLTEAEHAWRVRAALRAGAWRDVLAAIDAMPGELSDDAAWRYWKARALSALGRDAEAKDVHAAVAKGHGYYALLAAEALGQGAQKVDVVRDARGAMASADALQQFGAKNEVRRAVKLAELDLRTESRLEWNYAIRNQDDDALLLAAEYARRMNLYDRAINTAERTSARHDFGLRYLMPFGDQFRAAARDQSMDAALLFGVARQESRFNASIVSSAGAVGLMQLMPATAKWVARQIGRTDYRPGDIADVSVNTQFGAYYFRHCLERLDGLPALAAAAYNAGPGRAQAWRPVAQLEGAIWVETIPFNETRDYVKKVLANAMFYARELDQPYVALTARLGTVSPRGAQSSSTVASAR